MNACIFWCLHFTTLACIWCFIECEVHENSMWILWVKPFKVRNKIQNQELNLRPHAHIRTFKKFTQVLQSPHLRSLAPLLTSMTRKAPVNAKQFLDICVFALVYMFYIVTFELALNPVLPTLLQFAIVNSNSIINIFFIHTFTPKIATKLGTW